MTPLVKPTTFTKGSLGKVQNQMIQIITMLGQSDRTHGPKPNELVTKACETHYKYGPARTLLTATVVEKVYNDAVYLGLFNEKGKFTSSIQNGPDVGGKTLFEYIVPLETAPEFSQDISNLRLVLVSKKRKSNDLSKEEKIHLGKLEKIKKETRSILVLRERESGHLLDTSITGPDLGPHYERWEASMELAGEASNEPAEVKLDARKNASASSSNGERMSVKVKLNNYSDVPTKVTVHCFMLARSDIKRILFKIGHAQKEVVLLPKDEQRMVLYSDPFPSFKRHAGALDGLPTKLLNQGKFSPQGWVVRVEHKGGVVATEASMTKMIPMADEKYKELLGLP